MSEGQIPVGSGDLPIDTPPMDESQVYTGSLMRVTLSPKLDKRGGMFSAVQVEVLEGDFEGFTVMQNYLPLPVAVDESMPKAERLRAMARGVSFERFCRAFGIKGAMPIPRLGDSESCTAWQDWIATFYGNNGKFTVKNQEFPEGSGRQRSGVSDYVF